MHPVIVSIHAASFFFSLFPDLQHSMPVHCGVEWHLVVYRNLTISGGYQAGPANIPQCHRLHLREALGREIAH